MAKFRYQVKGFKSGSKSAFSSTPVHSRKEVEKKVTSLKKRGATRIETQVLTKHQTLGGFK